MFSPAKLAIFGPSALLAVGVFLMPSSAQVPNSTKAAKAKQQPQPAPRADSGKAEASGASSAGLDPAKLPDIVGVHLGMAPQEAMQAMRKQYPANFRVLEMPTNSPLDGQIVKGSAGHFELSDPATAGAPLGYITFTAPPEKQVVWHVARFSLNMHVNRDTLLATLRQKYGKETASLMSSGMGSRMTTDNSKIADMFWLIDEHGSSVPYPPETVFRNRTIWDCSGGTNVAGNAALARPDDGVPTTESEVAKHFPGWCASMVVVHVTISDPGPIIDNVFTEMLDVPLALRTAHSSSEYWRAIEEKAQKDELERSKKVKPAF
jgi:hypothetical protein